MGKGNYFIILRIKEDVKINFHRIEIVVVTVDVILVLKILVNLKPTKVILNKIFEVDIKVLNIDFQKKNYVTGIDLDFNLGFDIQRIKINNIVVLEIVDMDKKDPDGNDF